MSEGVIIGGWDYVIAAYSITAAGLIGYAWSLVYRCRRIGQKNEN